MLRYITILILLVCVQEGYAQFWKKSRANDQKAVAAQPNSVNLNYPSQSYAPKKSKVKGNKQVTYDARENFYRRLDLVAKEKRKAEKEMMKPQYSDPSYFGHKRPPKRHKPGKIRLCKECGIRH
jgi:hypothetical protein